MTEQEQLNAWFQTVWNYFVVHKNKASVEKIDINRHHCFLRSPEGRKCAIGVLIPDDKYTEDMETMQVLQALHKAGVIEQQIPQNYAVLLSLLRQAHDTSVSYEDFTGQFKKAMELIAVRFHITYQAGST